MGFAAVLVSYTDSCDRMGFFAFGNMAPLGGHETNGFAHTGNCAKVTTTDNLTVTQGAPCLSLGRGHRGGVLDEPYGGGTPPATTTREQAQGWRWGRQRAGTPQGQGRRCPGWALHSPSSQRLRPSTAKGGDGGGDKGQRTGGRLAAEPRQEHPWRQRCAAETGARCGPEHSRTPEGSAQRAGR